MGKHQKAEWPSRTLRIIAAGCVIGLAGIIYMIFHPAPPAAVRPAEKPSAAVPAPMHIFYPAMPQKPPASPPGPHTAVVGAGDTMWSLAKQYCGNAMDWPALQAANGNISPGYLPAGKTITIAC